MCIDDVTCQHGPAFCLYKKAIRQLFFASTFIPHHKFLNATFRSRFLDLDLEQRQIFSAMVNSVPMSVPREVTLNDEPPRYQRIAPALVPATVHLAPAAPKVPAQMTVRIHGLHAAAPARFLASMADVAEPARRVQISADNADNAGTGWRLSSFPFARNRSIWLQLLLFTLFAVGTLLACVAVSAVFFSFVGFWGALMVSESTVGLVGEAKYRVDVENGARLLGVLCASAVGGAVYGIIHWLVLLLQVGLVGHRFCGWRRATRTPWWLRAVEALLGCVFFAFSVAAAIPVGASIIDRAAKGAGLVIEYIPYASSNAGAAANVWGFILAAPLVATIIFGALVLRFLLRESSRTQ